MTGRLLHREVLVAVFAPEYEDVAQAGQRLGVSARRVRQLIDDGQLQAVRVGPVWLVLKESVDRRRKSAPRAGRPWNQDTAWGVLFGLSQGSGHGAATPPVVAGVDHPARERSRQVLEAFNDGYGFGDVAGVFRRRAVPHRLYGHPAALKALADDRRCVRSGASAAEEHGLPLSSDDQFEAYVPDEALAAVTERHVLMVDGRGSPNVMLRSVHPPWPFPPGGGVAPVAAVALDLLESGDPRYRRAGAELSERLRAVMIER